MSDSFLSAMENFGFDKSEIKIKKEKEKPKIIDAREVQPRRAIPVGISKAEKELELLDIKVRTAELNFQTLSKSLVLREDIQHVWNKIYRSASYFADFGTRYAGEWCALLGITDPEKIHILQDAVSESVELFIRDFSETVAKEIE